MIDLENEVFTEARNDLRAVFPDIYVSAELNLNPKQARAVFIEQADNYALTSSRDTSSNENHAVLMFEVNVIVTLAKGKKQEAKKIFEVVDTTFNRLGFTRQSLMPLSYTDSSEYRMVGRYTAVADKNQRIYRR